jgi:hypothetical protein
MDPEKDPWFHRFVVHGEMRKALWLAARAWLAIANLKLPEFLANKTSRVASHDYHSITKQQHRLLPLSSFLCHLFCFLQATTTSCFNNQHLPLHPEPPWFRDLQAPLSISTR